MFNKISQIFKVKDLRNKVFFILAILVVFRIAANIPVPGIDVAQLQKFFENNQLLGFLNMFSGGGLKNISIVMLGVGPYITASIIMQLLTMIFPQLEKMYKEEGEAGRQKFNMWTRYLTVPLAVMQGFAMISLFRSSHLIGDFTLMNYVTTLVTVTAGTIFIMWLGELITEKGLGNGVSLLIFAGIVAGLPGAIQQIGATWDSTQMMTYFSFIVVGLITIAGVVFVSEGQRNISISFARRLRGGSTAGNKSVLPLRVNQAGVIPIIFAMSIIQFPQMMATFLANVENQQVAYWAGKLADVFANQLIYGVMYFLLVVAFTYFYTAVTFDPKSVAENLQRQGSFISGIRPGVPTMEYLNKIVNRVTFTGSLFLGLIAVLPFMVQGLTGIQNMTIGGTSLLIVVSVVIKLMKQVDSHLVMRDYEGL